MIKYLSHLMTMLVIASMTTLCGAQKAPKTIGHFKQANNLLYVEGNGSVESFYISHRPVTNREYLLYLVWQDIVYAHWPEKLYEAWPGELPEFSSESTRSSIQDLIKESEDFVKEYIFHPEYLDFPVIGISWEQANDFCTWITDRFNEYSLINEGFMLWDPAGQAGGECFVTESYISNLYIGLVGEGYMDIELDFPRSPTWHEFNYAPLFRLPSRREISTALNNDQVSANLHPAMLNKYQVKKKDFTVMWWNTYHIFESQDGYIIDIRNPAIDYTDNHESAPVSYEETSEEFPLYEFFPELCLDSKITSELNSIPEIYKEYGLRTEELESTEKLTLAGDIKKNSLGCMPYRILSVENDIPTIVWTDKEAVYDPEVNYLYDLKTNTVVSDKYDRVFTCFRYAVSANWK